MKNNIVLIGMPGAGKSTLGVILAKVLGKDFIDADLAIQKKEGRLLSQIIEAEGPEGFLKIEEQVNKELNPRQAIIATGGSVVYGAEAMEHLRKIGTVVYLKLSCQAVVSRLRDIRGRGVVLREGQTMEGLYAERSVLYEKYAHVTVEEDGLTIEETLEKTLQALDLLVE
ncbi:MAG: shikimate kinase [Lachnospiraceae bacterium]|jgi:shikimate kinase|uniref:shikimate kinase n=1 Tax=Candidatus Merdisoma sp. JLR.KK006 TaxID=3112626 RepID=UPI002FF24043|nr:shikimate kinase [Lachnospiraceae bacterium]